MFNVYQGSKFTFNASALGLGGVLRTGGRDIVVPSLASVALAPTGGEGSSLVENYDRDGIAFTRAESRVAGYEISTDFFATYSDIFITNLRVLDTVKVALLQATITSTRHIDADESQFELHAMYRGIQVGDDEIEPELNIDICARYTYEELTSAMKEAIPQAELKEAELPDATSDAAKLLKVIKNRDDIRTTIVKNLQHRKGKSGAIALKNNQLIVRNFGSVHFGELLVKPGRRRVNLMRFELDPKQQLPKQRAVAFSELQSLDVQSLETLTSGSTSGSLTVGSGDGNGSPIWPR